MAANISKQRMLRATVLTIALVTVYWCAMPGKQLADPARSKAESREQQIESSAARVCCLLSADDGEIQQTTDLHMLFEHDGLKHVVYIVDCENDTGRHPVHTVWNGETGRLISADRVPKRGEIGQATASGVVNPAQVAWSWLERLDIANLSPHWQVPTPPVLIRYNWKVVLQSDQYCATVRFTRGGDLVGIAIAPADRATHLP